MKLNVEVSQSSHPGRWVWRVRSDDTRTGETFLALGLAVSEEDAMKRAITVRDSVSPHFTSEYRHNPTPTPDE
jgi:hypothetical protein